MNYDATRGWDFSSASPLGGIRGKRIDQAIADIAAQNPDIAAVIPNQVVGTFWKPACTNWLLSSPDPTRFAEPEFPATTGLSDDQIDQVLWNIEHRVNFYFAGYMNDGDRETFLSRMFRGEADHAALAFPRREVQPGFSLAGSAKAYVPPLGEAVFPHAQHFSLVAGRRGVKMPQPDAGSMDMTTLLCDPWWDLTTDVNVARYIRAWAIGQGVAVDMEPAP